MARPRKNNADYFSHDNDMRNDDKILAVRRKFGHEGYSIWNMLLEKLCKSDGFIIDVDNVSIELLSGDFMIEPDILSKMIEYFLQIKLLCKKGEKIYSQKLIDRFGGLLSKRQRDIDYRDRKQDNEVVIDVEKPQSKVKESIVNKNKDIINKQNLFDEFWKLYPNKKGKDKAQKKYPYKDHEKVMTGLKNYIAELQALQKLDKFAPNYKQGDTFINQKAWLDYQDTQAIEDLNFDAIYKEYKEDYPNNYAENWKDKYGVSHDPDSLFMKCKAKARKEGIFR